MSLDPKQQAELERNERWLASLMTAKPSDEAIARTRNAVRIAMEEQWLHGFATPPPAPELIARVKAAVHDVLRDRYRATWHRIFGALSAAAAVLFAIGLVRFAGHGARTTLEAPLGENFTVAWNAIEDAAGMSSLMADMAWLDEEIDGWTTRPARQSDEMELESIQDRMDGFFTTSDYFFGTS